jgi:hypothetical protein
MCHRVSDFELGLTLESEVARVDKKDLPGKGNNTCWDIGQRVDDIRYRGYLPWF